MDRMAERSMINSLGRIAKALENINTNLVQIGQNMKEATDDGAGND